MSDADDDSDFGPQLPLLAPSTGDHELTSSAPAEVGAVPSVAIDAHAESRKRLRNDERESNNTEHTAPPPSQLPQLKAQQQQSKRESGGLLEDLVPAFSTYHQQFQHSGSVLDVTAIRWSSGWLLLTLDTESFLRWWIKLPVGIFLAKTTLLSSSRGVDEPARCPWRMATLGDDVVALLDTTSGALRFVEADLLELGAPVYLPGGCCDLRLLQHAATCLVRPAQRYGTDSAHVIVADPANPEVTMVALRHCSAVAPKKLLPNDFADDVVAGTHVLGALSTSLPGSASNFDVSSPLGSRAAVASGGGGGGGAKGVFVAASGTMHPICKMRRHDASGLVIVIDERGILDYAAVSVVDSEGAVGAALPGRGADGDGPWRIVRGSAEWKPRGGKGVREKPPSWAKWIRFPTRAKTDFFVCFREPSSVVLDLAVSRDTILVTALTNVAPRCVVHWCLGVHDGRLLGTFRQPCSPLFPQQRGAGAFCCNHASSVMAGRAGYEKVSSSGLWLVPVTRGAELAPGEGNGSAAGVPVAHVVRINPESSEGAAGVEALSTERRQGSVVVAGSLTVPGDAHVMHIPCAVYCGDWGVAPSQQLRNFVSRSPLGAALEPESVLSLMSSGSRSDDFTALAVAGDRLWTFHSWLTQDELKDAALLPLTRRRDFTCAEIEESLGVHVIQKQEDYAEETETSLPGTMHDKGRAEQPSFPTATIVLSRFDAVPLVFRLLPFAAPLAVENFSRLAAAKFYDGLLMHRVIAGFMLQGGCPKGDGTGGKCMLDPPRSVFDDEVITNDCIVKATRSGDAAGLDLRRIAAMTQPFLLCMANCGMNTNQSQFFITTAPTPHLRGKHTIFGILHSDSQDNMERMIRILSAAERVQVDCNDCPVIPLRIVSVEVRPPGIS